MVCSGKRVTVLHVGPGQRSRGGIASVINAYEAELPGLGLRFRRLSTQDDRSTLKKAIFLLAAYMLAPARISCADMVHIHAASRNSWRRKLPIILLTKMMGRKLVIHIHGGGFAHFFESMPRWRLRFNRYCLSMADCVICLSASGLRELRPYLRQGCGMVIPNPCPSVPVNGQSRNGSPLTILFVGWIEKEKGIFDLVKAVAMILKGPMAARLIVAGKGRVEECRDLARSLGIPDKVDFPGWLDKRQLYQLYSAAHIFCLPSYIEGVPMSILEAMAFGLPIVTCPVGGIPEIIKEGVHGLFVKPGDVAGIAAALQRLIASPPMRNAMGMTCRNEVAAHYSISEIGGQLANMYASLLRQPTCIQKERSARAGRTRALGD